MHLLKFSEFILEREDSTLPHQEIGISEFLSRVRMPAALVPEISDWWSKNRAGIKIYLFPFSSPDPIAGIFLGQDRVLINERFPMPPHAKLFIALHESRHCDQHGDGRFMPGYWDTVVRDDLEAFLPAYEELERDANDFAIGSMRELGFEREMAQEEARLRGNERAGSAVFSMMRRDRERLGAESFFELLLGQVL